VRRRHFRLLSACLAVTLAACAATDNAPEPAKLPKITEFNQLPLLWRARVGNAEDFRFVPTLSAPGKVFAASAEGELAGFRLADGEREARFKLGKPLSGGVSGDGQSLIIATGKGEVLSVGVDGVQRWLARVNSEVLTAPVIANGLVLVRATDGSVTALDIRDGARRWIYQRSLPSLILRSQGEMLVVGRKLIIGMPGGKLVALSLSDGGVLWEAPIMLPRGATELERIVDVASAPVSDGKMVCAVAYQGRVACVDLESGNALWSRDVPSSYGLAIDHRNVYVTDELGAVLAYEKHSGRNLWKQGLLFARGVTAPALLGRHVVVGDFEGVVHLLSAEDGSFLSRAKTDGSAIRIAPAIVDDRVLIQTAKGGLFLFAIK